MNNNIINKDILKNYSLVFVVIIIAIISAIFIRPFLSPINIKGLLLSMSLIGMVTTTMIFVIALGEVDLSVGSLVALTGVSCVVTINATHSVFIGLLAALGMGLAFGFLHGLFVAGLGVNSFITTLGTMQIARGLAFLIAPRGEAVAVKNPGLAPFGSGSILQIPNPVWYTVILIIIFGFILNKTVFGKNILAVGGNIESAKLVGINVKKVKLIVFLLQGLVVAFAGFVLAARLTSGQPNAAQGLELRVISACVLGGVSLFGGIATIGGMLLGVFLIGIVENVMNLLNIPTFYQYVANGVILLIAIYIDRIKKN